MASAREYFYKGYMPKTGHPLRDIPDFDSAMVAQLRDELSITTAEELVGIWRSAPAALATVLGGQQNAYRLAQAAQRVIPEEDMDALRKAEEVQYPFRTGHEPPPTGNETF